MVLVDPALINLDIWLPGRVEFLFVFGGESIIVSLGTICMSMNARTIMDQICLKFKLLAKSHRTEGEMVRVYGTIRTCSVVK